MYVFMNAKKEYDFLFFKRIWLMVSVTFGCAKMF